MEIVEIEKEKIKPLTDNLRKMTDEDMTLLEKSMRDLGFIEPLHVVEYEGGKYYLIVNGNHRFQVLVRKLGYEKVPCVVLGKDWPMERVYSEVIRLNSISGEFDVVALVEKMGRIVKKWVSEGKRSEDILLNLGLRRKSSVAKLLLLGDEGRKKPALEKASDIGKLLKENMVGLAPISFFDDICVVKDRECVSLIREIMLSAEVDGFNGLEKIREVLRKGITDE